MFAVCAFAFGNSHQTETHTSPSLLLYIFELFYCWCIIHNMNADYNSQYIYVYKKSIYIYRTLYLILTHGESYAGQY